MRRLITRLPELAPLALTSVIFYAFAVRGLDIHHDGTAFKPALDVATGQTLFRDTFTQYGPLTTWIQAFFIKSLWFFAGPSIYSIKIATVVFYSLSALVLLELWALLLPRRLAWMCLLVWLSLAPFLAPTLVFLPWSSVYALFFQVLAAYLFLKGLEDPKPARLALLSGVSCAATFWCRQPIGILLTLGLGGIAFLYLLNHLKFKSAWQFYGFFKLGIFGTLGVVIAYLYFRGSLGYWFDQTIVWPAQWAKGTGGGDLGNITSLLLRRRNETLLLLLVLLLGRPFLRWVSRKSENTANIAMAGIGFALFWRCLKPFYQAGFFTLIPVFALVMTAGFLWRHRKTNPSAWFHLAWLALVMSSWAQFYPMNDPRHVYWAITPGIGLFVYWIHRWFGSKIQWTEILVSVWLFSNLIWFGQGAIQKLTKDYIEVDIPALKGIKLLPHQAKALEPLFAAVRSAKKLSGTRPIMIEGPDAFYSTLTSQLENSYRIPQIWKNTGLHETHFDTQGMDFVRKVHPWIISESTDTHFIRPKGLESYQSVSTVYDPDHGWETTLWIFKD